jgi:hypothetical protein
VTPVPPALPFTVPVVLPEVRDVRDHLIAGKATVPAVELLEFLVRTAAPHLGAGDTIPLPFSMSDAAFARFLPADEIDQCTFEVTLEHAGGHAGLGVRATLTSRIALAGGMRRARVHAECTLAGPPTATPSPPSELDCEFEVPAARMYRELIPFGPRFRNLRGTLRLGRTGATGLVRSPEPPRSPPPLAGCPYLLDAAMHMACLWGQRYAGVVAYPTGFATRLLTSPLAHGERRCIVVPRAVEPRRLLCDLWLTDGAGEICDGVLGLAMSPLAAASPPPAWISLAGERP